MDSHPKNRISNVKCNHIHAKHLICHFSAAIKLKITSEIMISLTQAMAFSSANDLC